MQQREATAMTREVQDIAKIIDAVMEAAGGVEGSFHLDCAHVKIHNKGTQDVYLQVDATDSVSIAIVHMSLDGYYWLEQYHLLELPDEFYVARDDWESLISHSRGFSGIDPEEFRSTLVSSEKWEYKYPDVDGGLAMAVKGVGKEKETLFFNSDSITSLLTIARSVMNGWAKTTVDVTAGVETSIPGALLLRCPRSDLSFYGLVGCFITY